MVTFRLIQKVVFITLLLTVTGVFVWLIHDFLIAVFWAIVLAIIFRPLEKHLEKSMPRLKGIPSILTILAIILLVVLPIFFVGGMVVRESIHYYQTYVVDTTTGQAKLKAQISRITSKLEAIGVAQTQVTSTVTNTIEKTSSWITQAAISFGGNTLRFLLQLFVMLYVLFYVLRDGDSLRETMMHILPVGDTKEKMLFERFASITRATIKGTFVIGAIQGAIGGILFFIAGISAPFLWATLMAFFAIIPAVGPTIIYVPAGLLLLASGSYWQGALVLLGGFFIVSTIDNIIRPPLLGRDTKMPDALILLSTLGGLTLFGISGFVIGPIITGFFLALWHMFEEEYHNELTLSG